jgi:streptogramin lyase
MYWLLLYGGIGAALLNGCGSGSQAPVVSTSSSGPGFRGIVHGGQQPVSGALITLYAAGLSGPGAGALNLTAAHTITTDQGGNFTIPEDYTCPATASQAYIVARGGNPGLAAGTNNGALVLAAALGDCSSLSGSTYISLNEVTTVASAWALQQFYGAGGLIGATPTNATGLRNAFLVAQVLANPSTGSSPGAALPTGTTTETAKLLTLANALAGCVNSDGGSACSQLFLAATVDGAVPSNTLDAALSIVRNPASQVEPVFKSSVAQAPFQPALTTAPNDWSMSITVGGCASSCGGLNQPGSVAVDSTGSVWAANYFGGVVSKFLPSGGPAAPQGYPGKGLNQSFGVAVDPTDNVWVTNENSVSGASNAHRGSVSKFDPTGAELSGFGYTGGGVYYPQGIASDPAGNLWIADYGSSSATLLSNSGSPLSGPTGFGASALPFTPAVAVDRSGNGWFAAQESALRVTPAGVVAKFSCCVDPAGIAIDPSGNVWLADYGGASLVELTPQGVVAATVESPGGTQAAQSLAIDSAGQIFAANFRGDSLTQLAGASGAVLSPVSGLGLDAPLNEPLGIAIDASGNLWVSNSGGSTLTEFVGLANPVKTPLQGPPTKP